MKTMRVNFWMLLIALLLPMICFGADGDGVTNEKQRVTIDVEDLGYVVGVILLVGTFLKNGLKRFPNDLIPAFTWVGGALLYLGLSKGWGDLRQWLAALMAVASATGLHSATTSTLDAAKNLKNGVVAVLLFGALSLGLTGCGTLYDNVITVKEVGDSISREYAQLYRRGLITPEQDARAEQIHAQYREAMGALAITLEAASANGDNSTVPEKLRAVKAAITPLLDLITPMLTAQRSGTLGKQLSSATAQ